MNKLNLRQQRLEFNNKYHSYFLDGNKIPSVTTIISATMAKPYLVEWSAKMASEAVINLFKPNTKLDKETIAAYADLAKNAYKMKRDTAADAGTSLHSLLDAYITTGQAPEEIKDNEVANSFLEFKKWRMQFNPEFMATEIRLASGQNQYAGCCDTLFKIDGKLVICDWKTSNSINSLEYNLQTAAYQIALEELECPSIAERYLLRLPKDGSAYEFKKVETPFEDDKEMFLRLVKNYQYIKKYNSWK